MNFLIKLDPMSFRQWPQTFLPLKRLFPGFLNLLLVNFLLSSPQIYADEEHEHSGHSDQLLVLLNYKIALQKLQDNFPADIDLQSNNLAKQKRYLDKALPILEAYLEVPAERYPNTSLYEQSLKNRSAMLQDYAHTVSDFYQKLVGG